MNRNAGQGRWWLAAAALVVMFPSLAAAQSITGVVRDTSGAVLPGVTVEASSPALIEKVRTAVSDGAGQYRIENLSPGRYKVTYTLPGFGTVERPDLNVTTGVTLTLNADMRVGGLQETITVTGETPVVDVQNSTRVQRVLSEEVLQALPASRGTAICWPRSPAFRPTVSRTAASTRRWCSSPRVAAGATRAPCRSMA